jgi:hypothetical protein
MLENFRQDWRTYNGDLSRRGLWVMAVYRFGRWRYTIKSGIIRKPFSLLLATMSPSALTPSSSPTFLRTPSLSASPPVSSRVPNALPQLLIQ